MKKFSQFLYALIFIMIFSTSCHTENIRLFASRFCAAGEKGLVVFDLNSKEGSFSILSEVDAGPDPSYFCISKTKGLIYAANEVMEFDGSKGGGVTALKYSSETGALVKVKDLVVPKGGPCYISLSPDEDYLLLANYSSSSIAVVKVDDKGIPEKVTDTISFSVNEGKVSHPHMISFDPAAKKVYMTDLGLDRIVIYDFDALEGRLKQIENGEVDLPEGSGPRHFAFNSTGTKMYLINELNSTISVFDVDQDGRLRSIQTLSTLGEDFKGENSCADIHLGKNGQYLYGSNRGENTLVIFRIENDGKLTFSGRIPCGGNWPRNFVIDPSGKYILTGNQKSGDISLFKIDEKTGIPQYKDEYKLTGPACLKF